MQMFSLRSGNFRLIDCEISRLVIWIGCFRNRFREILGVKEKEQLLTYEEHAASAAGGNDTGALYKC